MKAISFKLSAIFTLLLTVYGLQLTAYAEPVSSTKLIEKAKELDGTKVMYRGEAVTAILNRGEYSWVNLNDDANAIGVWCENAKLDSVRFIGDYKHKGDILEIDGTFNRACPAHGGELDIHADAVRLVKTGSAVEEDREWMKAKLFAALSLFLLSIFIIIIFRRRI